MYLCDPCQSRCNRTQSTVPHCCLPSHRCTTAPSNYITGVGEEEALKAIDTGDTAWILISTAIVLLMTPGEQALAVTQPCHIFLRPKAVLSIAWHQHMCQIQLGPCKLPQLPKNQWHRLPETTETQDSSLHATAAHEHQPNAKLYRIRDCADTSRAFLAVLQVWPSSMEALLSTRTWCQPSCKPSYLWPSSLSCGPSLGKQRAQALSCWFYLNCHAGPGHC